jgi:hypothetical protein
MAAIGPHGCDSEGSACEDKQRETGCSDVMGSRIVSPLTGSQQDGRCGWLEVTAVSAQL